MQLQLWAIHVYPFHLMVQQSTLKNYVPVQCHYMVRPSVGTFIFWAKKILPQQMFTLILVYCAFWFLS